MSNDPDGTTRICTPAEFAIERSGLSGGWDPNTICLTRGQSIGLTLTVEAGVFSGLVVLWVFGLIIRNVRRFPGERLIKRPMDVYMLFLFTADLVQALGAVMGLKWVTDGRVQIGDFCTAQGTMKQLGAATVAITTLIIAIQTFLVIWKGKDSYKHAVRRATFIVAVVALFSILFIAISIGTHKSHPFYAPTSYWCWIGKNYTAHRVLGEYLWMWLALIFSILLYTSLFFMLQPPSQVQQSWWQLPTRWINAGDPATKQQRRTALCMVVYPIAYSIVTVPLIIARWTGFKQEFTGDRQNHVDPAFTLVASTIFGLSGVVNVLLFLSTRPNLLLFGR